MNYLSFRYNDACEESHDLAQLDAAPEPIQNYYNKQQKEIKAVYDDTAIENALQNADLARKEERENQLGCEALLAEQLKDAREHNNKFSARITNALNRLAAGRKEMSTAINESPHCGGLDYAWVSDLIADVTQCLHDSRRLSRDAEAAAIAKSQALETVLRRNNRATKVISNLRSRIFDENYNWGADSLQDVDDSTHLALEALLSG